MKARGLAMQHDQSAVITASQEPAYLALQSASRDAVSAHQMGRMRTGMQRILPSNRFYQRKLTGLDLGQLTSLDGLRQLPFTTKAELAEDQHDHPPYGTNLTYLLRDYVRLHRTSGTTGQPLTILDTPESWDWWAECWTAVYQAAG